MKHSIFKKIYIALLLVILLCASLIIWLIATESGLHAIYRYAVTDLPSEVTIDKLEGSLISTISAKGIRYQQDGIVINTSRVTLEWLPSSLLVASVDISHLHVQSLTVTLPPTEKNSETAALPEIYMPWRVTIKNMVIDDVSVHQADKIYRLNTINLNASTLFSKIDVESLKLVADTFDVIIKGELHPTQDYYHKLNIDWHVKLPAKSALSGSGRIEGNGTATNVQQQVNGPIQLTLNADIYDLFKQFSWQAEANIIDVNPGKLWPEWPAQLTGKLTSKGKLENGQLLADTNDIQLKGKLRDYPMSLQSRLAWRNNGLDISILDLHSGSARISAQGRLGSVLNMTWDISAKNLAELYPHANGQLQAKGRLTGSQAAPKIDASFNGKILRVLDYEVATIDGEVSVDLFRWQQIKIKLAALSLKLKDHEIQALHIDSDTQHLTIKAISNIASTLIEVRGKADDQGWHGHIEKVDIQSTHFANWSIPSPATLKINKKTFLLDSMCLQSKDSRFCTTLQRENEIWKARLEMSKLPLLLFSSWLPADLKIEGRTDATAELNFHAPEQLAGKVHVILPRGVVSYPLLDGGRGRWEYNNGTVSIKMDRQGLEASSDIAMTKGGRFKAQLSLPGAKWLAMENNQTLQASAKLNMHDLGLIEALVPEVQELKGQMRLSFSATGTLGHLKLSGHTKLLNGTLRIPKLGLSVKQLTLNSQSDGFEKLEFQLGAQSGDGHLTVKGQTTLNRLEGWPTSITIKGNEFEVSHIPVARVVVSPNLHITVQKHKININGDVHVPYAKLQPKDITTAARVSQDVVILGGDQPVEERWSVFTKVRLTLGKRVNFFGYGFEGRFDGSLLLEDEPGKPTKATGEIKVPEGRYNAYGQRLDVEHGRLLYTGGPLTNPGLDLRAVRRIGNITAGLKVRGSLNQPQVEVFSIPAMGQTDAFAYLILGRPIENASNDDGALMAKAALALGLSGGDSLVRMLGDRFGLDEIRIESSESGDQASLVIGRYLSPKLYVGYGIGLIESFNTFNVRYDISDKWQLKGESGLHQGADLLYTIER